MTRSYQHRADFTEKCPNCGTEMHPVIEGMVEGGQSYDDTVRCSSCGKILRQAESAWPYRIAWLLVAAPFVLPPIKWVWGLLSGWLR